MPKAALAALEGKLAEGVDPMSVIEALQEAGWKPPEGEAGYEEGAPPEAPPEMGDAEAEPMEGEPEAPGPGLMIALGGKGDMNDRRSKAAKSAMKKHGHNPDEDEEY